MNRGIFDVFSDNETYRNSKKEWLIELQQTKMYWYELLVNGHEEIDTRRHIISQLKSLKKEVESCLEKRFIYFICSRKKVRFCINTPPVPTPYYGFMKLRVLIGREKTSKEFVVSALYDENSDLIVPEIDSTGRFILFTHQSGRVISFSIHDYLLTFGVNLGLSTKVEYVGMTKNPNDRPLNGVHGGLSDVLYNVSNDDNDILIYFNLFKVISNAARNEYNISYSIANSMIDEVKVEKEGRIIEKAFRFYFDSNTQIRHRPTERRELINDLKNISNECRIKCLHILFAVEGESEYYKFNSSLISPKHEHCFTVELAQNDISINHMDCSVEEFAIKLAMR